MDFNGIQPAPGEAALIVPHEWAKPHGDYSHFGLSGGSAIPYTSVQDGFDMNEANIWLTRSLLNTFITARRAGLKLDMPREYSNWQAHRLLLLPSPLTSTERNLVHVHTAFWDQVREHVQAGGLLYASLCADAAIPEMESLFGASLSDHASVEQVTLTFMQSFGEMMAGETLNYRVDSDNPLHWPATLEVTDGQVIAMDQDGRPALIVHSFGKGKTLLSAYPLETYLAMMSSVFERSENTHQIYRGLMQLADFTPLFSTDVPGVEVTGLMGEGRGYVVLVNHEPEKRAVIVTSRNQLKTVQQIDPNAKQALTLNGNQWQMEIPEYGGAIVEWTL